MAAKRGDRRSMWAAYLVILTAFLMLYSYLFSLMKLDRRNLYLCLRLQRQSEIHESSQFIKSISLNMGLNFSARGFCQRAKHVE